VVVVVVVVVVSDYSLRSMAATRSCSNDCLIAAREGFEEAKVT